jgi:glutamate/tyrosine decarboxylase-like PLP-dependent enzyme
MNDMRHKQRNAPIDMSQEEFSEIGHFLVDQIAEYLSSLPDRKVTQGETPREIRDILGKVPFPKHGTSSRDILEEFSDNLFEHSLSNGHPRFLGYITSSAAPIGILGDFLASAVNSNVGAWQASQLASEIEAQTIRWIAELIGYSTNCGGLMVSGGNVANFVGFIIARTAKANWNVRTEGMTSSKAAQLRVYCSAETHTWIEKAADHYGLGTDAIRWIPTNEQFQMDVEVLESRIEEDRENGDLPFLVVGTAGSTAIGAIDDLPDLARVCRRNDLWLHVDAAYGGFAACLPDASEELKGLSEADSVAIDPHKWLYSPLEAGCVLVRDPQRMVDTFSYTPTYYQFKDMIEGAPINYYEFGPQNSRGFRAFKVWLALRQVGFEGYARMISEDIRLSKYLYQITDKNPEFEAHRQSLSITTFRYAPSDLELQGEERETYLNQLNTEILAALQKGGEAFLSNAIVNDKFLLRSCIVNFRTSQEDIEAIPEIILRLGLKIDERIRS